MTARAVAGTLAALALLLAIGWTFAPILANGFVWDDGANLIAARANWDQGLRGIAWAFREPFAGHYQPVTWLSYQLDARLSGATPRGVHASQLALHLLVTLAVAALAWTLARTSALQARRALQGFAFPLLAAALFALAPIRVESVAWATERRDLLGTLFTVAAVTLYLRSQRPDGPSLGARLGTAALAALAALSRAQMTLPFVLVLLDVWPLGRLATPAGARLITLRRLISEKALLFVVAAASASAGIWAQTSSGALTALTEHGVLARLVQAGYGLACYPLASLLPVGLGPFLPLYERPAPFPLLAPRYLLPALASGMALIVIWRLRRRTPALAVTAGAYGLLLLPVLGLAQSGIQLIADRYAYLATLPWALLAAGGCTLAHQAVRRRVAQTAIAAALLALLSVDAVIAHRQTQVWRDDETLWRHVLAHSVSSLADNNLGQLLFARGATGDALFHLTRCLERAPSYPRPWRALAALLEAPWPDGAPSPVWVATTLARAASAQSGLTVARYATALAWVRSGDDARAEVELRRLLAIDPEHDGARLALARIEARQAVSGPAPPARP